MTTNDSDALTTLTKTWQQIINERTVRSEINRKQITLPVVSHALGVVPRGVLVGGS